MALTDPRAPLRALQTRFSLPHEAASLQPPSSSPTPRRKSRTKETWNKNQERGSGRRGPVSDQPDPQEEIIETRLRHVPGDGMCRDMGCVGATAPCQPFLGAAGRDQPLTIPTPRVRRCWPRRQGKRDIRKWDFGRKPTSKVNSCGLQERGFAFHRRFPSVLPKRGRKRCCRCFASTQTLSL